MGAPDPQIDRFMAEVARLCSTDPRLNSLSAAILAGVAFDIAHDSRGFARALGIEHALVLREVQALRELGRITMTKRDERTQRCCYETIATPERTSNAISRI